MTSGAGAELSRPIRGRDIEVWTNERPGVSPTGAVLMSEHQLARPPSPTAVIISASVKSGS